MGIKNDQAGLTLVELLVTVLVASIVTLAATTVLLLGLRIHNQSTKTAQGQNTVQVLMEALEDVAAEAEKLNIVETAGEDGYSWQLKESDEQNARTFFSYANNTVYNGSFSDVSATPFLENVKESYVTLSKNGILTIDVVTEEGNYSTSVYCRMVTTGDTYGMELIETLNAGNSIVSNTSRNAFLKQLASQYGSRGKIIGSDDEDTDNGKYYSEWYIGGYENNPSWNKDTPWCACYVSWALVESGAKNNTDKDRWFANVHEFASYYGIYTKEEKGTAQVGDLIFFNFDADPEADHVGVVLATDNSYIYTIEGNTAGKVAVRKYAAQDTRILGYGVLSWN